MGDIEHDPVELLTAQSGELPDPLATSVVNYAIRLFSQTFLYQSSSIQQGALEQMSIYLAGAVGQQNAAKEQSITLNIVTALLLALGSAQNMRTHPSLTSSGVQKAFQELLNVGHSTRLAYHQTFADRNREPSHTLIL